MKRIDSDPPRKAPATPGESEKTETERNVALVPVPKPPEPHPTPTLPQAITVAPPVTKRASAIWRRWPFWVVLALVLAAVTFLLVRTRQVPAVNVMHAQKAVITETVTSSGRVHGVTETIVGAQAAGVVRQLFVAEGDEATRGQTLAILDDTVAQAQVSQAQQAVGTAQAQLAEVVAGSRASDIQAAEQLVQQGQAQVAQQQATVAQVQQTVAQAQSQLGMAQAEQRLSQTEYNRTKQLYETGVTARSELDQAQTNLEVANQKVANANQAVRSAQESVRAAQAAVRAAEANVATLAARGKTVRQGPTTEEVRVARQRLAEAERALGVAQQQAGNAVVTAPFDGIVTEIVTQVGQMAGQQGILRYVSKQLEIRVDVDETNLRDLALGQESIISSDAFPGSTFKGSVSDVGAAVDPARGVVTLKIAPVDPPSWLRPGQTVNVNVITNRSAERLLVPPSAIASANNQTVVFAVEDGQAVAKPIVTRPPTEKGVPVIHGLNGDELIVVNPTGIKPGDRVRVRSQQG